MMNINGLFSTFFYQNKYCKEIPYLILVKAISMFERDARWYLFHCIKVNFSFINVVLGMSIGFSLGSWEKWTLSSSQVRFSQVIYWTHKKFIDVLALSPLIDHSCALKIPGFTLRIILEMRGSTRGFSPEFITWKKMWC